MQELDFRYEEPASRSRHRQRSAGTVYSAPPTGRKRKRKNTRKRRGGGRSFMALVIILILLGGMAGVGYLGFQWLQANFGETPDYAGPGTGEVLIEVTPGQTATQIADTLFENDVVASREAFIAAAIANPDHLNIQPGTYQLKKQMRAEDALLLLLNPESRVQQLLTIPEGLTKFHTYERLSEELGIPVEDFEEAEAAALELVPDEWFQRGDGKEADGGIEGFLFPNTYDFGDTPTAQAVLETMVNQFLAVADDLNFVERVQAERGISPYEGLIAASIAQAEAGTEGDLAKVARVAYNRVYRQFMRLEMDVTTNYGLLARGEEGRTSEDLGDELFNPENRYSTHAHDGWPPGPIGSPGRAALQAAVEPAEGNWLFFVLVDPETGESAFASTNAEHEANKQLACQNGVELSDC